MSEDRVVAPRSVEDMKALTELKSTEASRSFARFLNENLGHIEGFHISEEQAWTVLYSHRVWQQSDERKNELKALKDSKAQEAEARKAERDKKAEERKAEAARKAEEKKAKEAAKAAAAAGDDSDIDAAAAPAEGEQAAAAPRRRRAPQSAQGVSTGTI